MRNSRERKGANARWYERNKAHVLARTLAYRRANPEKVREFSRKARYGLTNEALLAMLALQAWACAVCGTAISDGARGCHVDHHHETGRVRGLLCGLCNRGIGFLKDDPRICLAAFGYLMENK